MFNGRVLLGMILRLKGPMDEGYEISPSGGNLILVRIHDIQRHSPSDPALHRLRLLRPIWPVAKSGKEGLSAIYQGSGEPCIR